MQLLSFAQVFPVLAGVASVAPSRLEKSRALFCVRRLQEWRSLARPGAPISLSGGLFTLGKGVAARRSLEKEFRFSGVVYPSAAAPSSFGLCITSTAPEGLLRPVTLHAIGLHVLLTTFLGIISACAGFASAIFFAIGTLRLRARDVADIAGTYWDFNEHLANSIASQRSEYIAGAVLLFLSFAAQLASNLASSSVAPALLATHWQALCLAFLFFLVVVGAAAALARYLAKSTQHAVRNLLERTKQQ